MLNAGATDSAVGKDHSPGTPEVWDAEPAQGDSTAAPTAYAVALAAGVVSLFLGGSVGLIAWTTVVVSGWALITKAERQGRWMAWTGLVLGVVYSLVNAATYGHLDALSALQEDLTTPRNTQVSQEEPSLGVTTDEFIRNWDKVAQEENLTRRKLSPEDTENGFVSRVVTGSIEVQRGSASQVRRLEIEAPSDTSLRALLDHTCLTLAHGRACSNGLYASWRIADDSNKVTNPRDAARFGICWIYTGSEKGTLTVRAEPLRAVDEC